MSEAPERIFAAMIDGELKASVNPIRSPFAREYIRADLLPVVKPLVWERLHSGGIAAVCPSLGLFHISCDENGRFFCYCSGAKIFGTKGFNHEGFDSETEAKKAVSEWREARIRASLDMIDPAALVAGAYEVAIRACINMGLLTDHPNDAGSTVLRALTPADAQAALDAAIAKAVNKKLDEVAAYCERHAMAVVTQPSKAEFCGSYVAVRTYGYGEARHAGMAYAAAILAMKEPE